MIVYLINRSMAHALPPWGSHKLGTKDGMDRHGWKAPQSEAAAPTVRSSKVLTQEINFFVYFFFPFILDHVSLLFFFFFFLEKKLKWK